MANQSSDTQDSGKEHDDLTKLPTADDVADSIYGKTIFKPNFVTITIGLIVLASFGVWVYAYSGAADRPPPDVLDSKTYASKAEAACAQALSDLSDVPIASKAKDAQERSLHLQTSTERFEEMLDEVEALQAKDLSERDNQLITEWLSNWRTLIGDRYRFINALAEDTNARYIVTDLGVNEAPERRISRFATVNSMESCKAPDDVG